jgi:hypothetical protein
MRLKESGENALHILERHDRHKYALLASEYGLACEYSEM